MSVHRQLRSLASGLLSIAITLLGLAALTFCIGRLLPIDPVLAVLGESASAEAYAALHSQLGLDRSLPVQFGHYLLDLLRLDFGNSLVSGQPVLSDIARVFPATLELATVAMLIGTGLGIPLGVLAAARRNGPLDHGVRIVGLLCYSAPGFWLGLMALALFYAALGWVGGPGRLDFAYQWNYQNVTGFVLLDALWQGEWQVWRNAWAHLVLPASILGLGAFAYISRMTRSFMLEQLQQEYIVTARVKGLSWTRTLWLHAFPNIAVQVITVVALSYAFLLEGAVLIETVFAWPGFGRYMTNALMAGDMNAVVGCTLLVGVIFVALNQVCDWLYRLLDPRSRAH
ncbi:peptide ABC transporter permease [Stutzerimonas kirkiae]|uniref:Peptide ABC transporter permease n=1 Tax=Stutzerimonas kirkiae TaxID=2211392 RepID=A0A4Q9R9T8_9GAMM|nr:ABC transporter permease [Stutzerimonas kirkiae]TBU96534.1 peptide ABC transporter permease [Stutzerimonas kirkiae]TBV02183.1 peptide ABC transporter permease [Stutzerimonas kirkiae]TBV15688.1 peptide ABC transporter permease [Stutzerimonas kirkiae]